MRRPRQDLIALDPRRVCVIKPSSLGDVVHALPTLTALRERWPRAHLSWVINRGLTGLLDGHPAINEVIPFDRGRVGLSPGGLAAFASFLRSLRARRFDLVLDLQGLLRSGLMTAATGAPVRVGLADAREGSRWFYTHRIPADPGHPHAVDRLLAVAGALGASRANARSRVALGHEDRVWARDRLAGLSRPRVLVNVGARWVTKRWPPESFALVARRAAETLGASLITVGSPEDRPLVERFVKAAQPTPVLDLCGSTSLPRLAAVAAECDLLLSNDTGPLHLAAAAGAPVLGIYTCTRPEWTGPYGTNGSTVRTSVWCAGSCLKRCDRMECLTELSTDRVWLAVRQRLEARTSRPFGLSTAPDQTDQPCRGA